MHYYLMHSAVSLSQDMLLQDTEASISDVQSV